MENIITRILNRNVFRMSCCSRQNHTEVKPTYRTNDKNAMNKEKKIHPYRKIHNWKSSQLFCRHILQQVIYNEDGLVAINKPYGISGRIPGPNEIAPVKKPSNIPNEVNYTLPDVLPFLAAHLGYESLKVIRTPEKFTSGVTLLGINEKVSQAVAKSLRRAEGERILPKTYWTVNRKVPLFKNGERRLAMKLKKSPELIRPVPTIVDKWSNNERERGDIKIMNVQFKTLATSSFNLASLVEIKSSTAQWHAVRLFAATILASPVLGDRIYGSRTQNVLGKWIAINPLLEAAHVPPKLEGELLHCLKVQRIKDTMIPAHVHLREIYLPSFLRKDNNVKITAGLPPSFVWTCQKLGFEEKLLENGIKLEDYDLSSNESTEDHNESTKI